MLKRDIHFPCGEYGSVLVLWLYNTRLKEARLRKLGYCTRKLGCNKKSSHLPQHSVSTSWNPLIYRRLRRPNDSTLENNKGETLHVSFQTFSFLINKLIMRKMKMYWLSMSVHALLTVHVSAVRSFEREMNEHSSYSLGTFCGKSTKRILQSN